MTKRKNKRGFAGTVQEHQRYASSQAQATMDATALANQALAEGRCSRALSALSDAHFRLGQTVAEVRALNDQTAEAGLDPLYAKVDSADQSFRQKCFKK